MDNFISEDTVIKDAIYLVFKDSVVCPICSNILIEPWMCMKCQNVYCRKCIDEWSKKDNKCPNRCENPNYQKSIEKNNILSKLKFKCQKCGEEIFYSNVKSHVDSCKPNDNYKVIDSDFGSNNLRRKRMKIIMKADIDKMEKNDKLAHITSKQVNIKFYLINIVITLGDAGVGKSCLIDT